VFNETDFNLKIPAEKKPKQLMLVLRPKGKGLYHVTKAKAPAHLMCPFNDEQVLSAQKIAYGISIFYDQIIRNNYIQILQECKLEREQILKSLFDTQPPIDSPSSIASSF